MSHDTTLTDVPRFQASTLTDEFNSSELAYFKQLYHKLQNLEDHPEAGAEGRAILLRLLALTVSCARRDGRSDHSCILSVRSFNPEELTTFLWRDYDRTLARWQLYTESRKQGGTREVFRDLDHAKWWLKQSAPLKYVDGAWLGHVHKVTTPARDRDTTRATWQVLSEELGDGDLRKNHVTCYESLMDEIGADVGKGNGEKLIAEETALNDINVWKAAVAQLVISLDSNEFLPEIIGYNMAYERLPLHLMKEVYELKELKINPYYFQLHIAIDNGHSGHAAMAKDTVVRYLTRIRDEEGEGATERAWRRVQAGYILAEGMPTTPKEPSAQATNTTYDEPASSQTPAADALLEILRQKAPVAHKVHEGNTRARIGGRGLVSWLDPSTFDAEGPSFLDVLARSKVWVVPGNPKKSKIVTEFEWSGRMFGAMSEKEVAVLRRWVKELDPRPPSDVGGHDTQRLPPDGSQYYDFVYGSSEIQCSASDRHRVANACFNVLAFEAPQPGSNAALAECFAAIVANPCAPRSLPHLGQLLQLNHGSPIDIRVGDFSKLFLSISISPSVKYNFQSLLPLWYSHMATLENIPTLPAACATSLGMDCTRILRMWYGFSEDGGDEEGEDETVCRGIDEGEGMGVWELGDEICAALDLRVPRSLADFLDDSTKPTKNGYAEAGHLSMPAIILSAAGSTYRNLPALLGMALGWSRFLHGSYYLQSQLPSNKKRGQLVSSRAKLEFISYEGQRVIKRAIRTLVGLTVQELPSPESALTAGLPSCSLLPPAKQGINEVSKSGVPDHLTSPPVPCTAAIRSWSDAGSMKAEATSEAQGTPASWNEWLRHSHEVQSWDALQSSPPSLSGLALARAQSEASSNPAIPANPTSTAGIPTIEGALVYDGPPVIGFTGPGGNATVQSGNPATSYKAVLPSISFDDATGSDITGTIVGSANANGVGVTFTVNFAGIPSVAEYGPFVYHIHALAVPADGNCTSTLGHLDPTDRGELHSCEVPAPQTCQAGDLAGKHGNITASTWSVSYSDDYLSTDPSSAYFFGDKSLVIHSSNATRLTCANFELVSNAVSNATATFTAPSPTISLFQGVAASSYGKPVALAGIAAMLLALFFI